MHERHRAARLRNTNLISHPMAWHTAYDTRRKAETSLLDSCSTWPYLGGFTDRNFRRDPNDLRRAKRWVSQVILLWDAIDIISVVCQRFIPLEGSQYEGPRVALYSKAMPPTSRRVSTTPSSFRLYQIVNLCICSSQPRL